MADITYKVDYPDPTYIQEASNDSRRELKIDLAPKCSCFTNILISLVVPWSNHIDWWYRCNKCGNIIYAYDRPDEDNDNALKWLMKEAGFKFEEKNFMEYVESFLRKITE